MKYGSRSLYLVLLTLVFTCVATARPPILDVTPDVIDRTGNQSISANRDHNVTLMVTNKDARQPVYNVTLPQKNYLTYSDNQFNLNISETRNITATVHTPVPTTIDDRFTWNKSEDGERDPIRYYYNETGGNESEITYNAEYFPVLNFQIESYRLQTTVKTASLGQEFNLSFGESDQSVFQIKNTGRETAYNVTFEGENIQFNRKEGINLSSNDDTFVSYTVELPKPEENATAATNQTYNRTITVSGDNFPTQEIQLQIFVPYHDYGQEPKNESLAPLLEEFKQYCATTGNCSRIREVVYRNRTVYQNKTFVNQANLSNATLAAIRELADNELKDDRQTRQRIDLMKHKFSNDIQSLNQSMRLMLRKAVNNSEQAKELAQEAKQADQRAQQLEERRKKKAAHQTMLLLVLFLVFGAVIGLSWFIYKTYQRSNDYRLMNQ